jgi:uncharacterized Zn finger protein
MNGRYKDFHWDYYSQDQPRKVKDGLKTKSERGSIGETWWSQRWLKALESLGMGTRLSRGRFYARQGQVLSIDIGEGHVNARVQGSRRDPYKVTISLQMLNASQWEQATEVMSARAIFSAKLLANEMPSNIEEAFQEVHLSLFPTAEQDLRTSCSCPDWAHPCKHAAAVFYLLAERFDEDPFLLFKLRGRSQEALLADIKQKRLATLPTEQPQSLTPVQNADSLPDAPPLLLEDSLENFWQCAEPLESFSISPHTPTVEQAILKRLGPAPYNIGSRNLSALLARIYTQVEEAALNTGEYDDS